MAGLRPCSGPQDKLQGRTASWNAGGITVADRISTEGAVMYRRLCQPVLWWNPLQKLTFKVKIIWISKMRRVEDELSDLRGSFCSSRTM